MSHLPFAVKSEQIVTPFGLISGAILIENGLILDVVPLGELPSDWSVDDVGDLVVMPGLIDMHVHINEPGRTAWEGFATATQAAAVGGITTVVDMPLNSTPVTTTVPALQDKLTAAQNQLWVDCGFYGGVVPGNQTDLEPLLQAGVLGLKAFMVHSGIDDFPNASVEDLRQAAEVLRHWERPLLVHAELDHAPAPAWVGNPASYASYLASRPAQWETEAIRPLIEIAAQTNTPLHVVHLSASEAVPMLQEARLQGIPLTVETAPHYLYFAAEQIVDGDTRFKCAPPIRGQANQERLWQALHEGDIDIIATDHSPCTPDLKRLESGDFQRAWGGIASLQFLLPITWTAARQRGFNLTDLTRWLSQYPAILLGLGQKGASPLDSRPTSSSGTPTRASPSPPPSAQDHTLRRRNLARGRSPNHFAREADLSGKSDERETDRAGFVGVNLPKD